MLLIHIKNNNGVTLIELLVAIVLVAIGIVSVMTVFPTGWQLTTQSDRIGQASEIMHRELATAELTILNTCPVIMAGTVNFPTVFSSGRATAQQGDMQYSVTRTITPLGANRFSITVQVTWAGNPTGITGSVVSGRDENYKEGC